MEFDKDDIVLYYDELSRVLTEYEGGEISALELYDFMVYTHRKLSDVLN